MAKKQNKAYVKENLNFIEALNSDSEVIKITQGVYYKILTKGEGKIKPQPNSVVTVRYEGRLIDGTIFDTSLDVDYGIAFRVRELIEGWMIALQSMVVGDKWEIYLSSDRAYGPSTIEKIPGGSTLIFKVELCSIN